MRIDVIARSFGTPQGGQNGMAIAAGFLAETLERLGHGVRRLSAVDGFDADMIITTVSGRWRHAVAAAQTAGAIGRLVFWHHHGLPPVGHGCILAAPPSIPPQPREQGWSRHVVLPPSSWAVERGGKMTGGEIVVAGAGTSKGGLLALQAARFVPGERWLVLRGRSSEQDRNAWKEIKGAEVTPGVIDPEQILSRARLILSPTRFEVHPLLLVEAAVRGIPIVCTDIPATRVAAGPHATYVPMNAKPEAWASSVRDALNSKPPKLQLPPYRDVVSQVIGELIEQRAAA